MTQEALKLALEALERGETELRWKAINIVKEALAQPKQEPVAWITKTGSVWKTKWEGSDIPLYITPPQNTWIGLTDEERLELAVNTGAMSADWLPFMEATEAKLKQKNGYAEEKNT